MWDLEQEPGPEQEDYWAWAENDVMLMRVIDPSDTGTGGWGGALCVEMGFYEDISWESRCDIEINV